MVVIVDTPPKLKDEREKLPAWLEIVQRQVASLRFGVVQIVVHESEVTQIDKTERVRLQKPQSRIL